MKYYIVIIPVLLFSSLFSQSCVPFLEQSLAPSLRGLMDTHPVDLDNDGDIDIVTASFKDDKVAWFENIGGTSFALHIVHSSLNGAFSVNSADFDGDGDIDLLAAGNINDKVSWYENDGDENFVEHIITSNTDGVKKALPGDIDGDGDIDVVSVSNLDDKVAWYANDGSGNFTSNVISSNVSSASDLCLVDLDGDTDLDVLAASNDGFSNTGIYWFENNGAGTFVNNSLTSTDKMEAIVAGDVDADGDIDVVGYHQYKYIKFYENDGSQNFTQSSVSSNAESGVLGLSDVDDDGDLDILAADWADRIVAFNNVGNNFSTIHILNSYPDPFLLTSLTQIDLDQDGDEDIIYTTGNFSFNPSHESSIAWMEKDSLGFETNYITTYVVDANMLVEADVDGDGDMDILSANSTAYSNSSQNISWYRNEKGNFSHEEITSISAYASTIAANDIDGDGDIDVVALSSTGSTISWYENDSIGNFTEHVINASNYSASYLLISDTDGDGDNDIIASSFSDDEIHLYENDGVQNFTFNIIISSVNGPNCIYNKDIDGDGDLDIISSSRYDDKIAWHENQGSNTFVSHVISTNADEANSIYASDLDGDGDIDVVSSSSEDDKIAWYENDGAQSFTEQVITTSANSPSSVKVADVDNDGDEDILAARASGNNILWYLNDGSGSFSSNKLSDTAYSAGAVIPSDIDGDGDLDVVGFYYKQVLWFENTLINTISLDLCDSLVSPSQNQTWYTSGMYLDTSLNSAGCDSILNIDLTIRNSSFRTDSQVACSSYQWIDGWTYTQSTNNEYYYLTNAVGCDSVINLDLSIKNSYFTDIHSVCDSLTWIDGNVYTNDNNTAMDTLINSFGCDSIVTLNLTINKSYATDVQMACDSFIWIDGNTYTASNNSAQHILTNSLGCDSVVTLDLTINNSSQVTDVQVACESYKWINGVTYTSSNNSATHVLSSAFGCDSVVMLDLTINTVNDSVINSSPVLTAVAANAAYQWLNCDSSYSIISGATNQSFTASANGSYAVELSQNSCVDTSDCQTISGVFIIENTFETIPVLYPNPTNGNISVDMGVMSDNLLLTLRTIGGSVIWTKGFQSTALMDFEIKEVPGIYMLDISNKEGKRIKFQIIKL